MADELSLIISALQGSDKAAQASNPYGFLSDTGELTGNIFKQAAGTGKYDLEDIALGSFVSGLIGGAGKNLGGSYVAEQNKLAQDYLFGNGTKPEGINDDVFSSVSKSRSIFDLARGLESQSLRAKAGTEMNQEVMKAFLENPEKAKRGLSILQSLNSPQSQPPAVVPGEAAAAPTGAVTPATPAVSLESYLEKFGGDETLAREAYKADVIEKPEKNEDRLSGLRKEFQSRPEIQSFVTSDIGIKSLKKALTDPSGTSDLELIRGAIQAIEPGMAVREGEAAAVQQSGAIPDIWRASIDGALTGNTKLPEDVRQGIVRIAQRRYNEYANKFNLARSFYQNEANRMGLPNGVTYLGEAALEPEQAAPASTPAPAAPTVFSPVPGIKIVQGQEYHLKQGQWVKVNR